MGFISHNGIGLPVPAGWVDGTQLIITGQEVGGVRPSIVVTSEPASGNENAEQYAKRQLPQLKEMLPGFTVAAEGAATFGQNPGFAREYHFKAGEHTMMQKQFHTVSKGSVFTLTYTNVKSRFEADKKVAESIFTGARFNEATASSAPGGFAGGGAPGGGGDFFG